ncbi:MAG: hypothetical protein KJ011_06525 [Burkholderiaceae bacterium]|nr:hypothetical protein [Burkholderiaceae bacterium]
MRNRQSRGERVPLPADAPPGAVSAWRYPESPRLAYRDRQGRWVWGSSRPLGPSFAAAVRQRAEQRALWLAAGFAEERADEGTRIEVLWVRAWRRSGSGLPFEQWLGTEIDRLIRVSELAHDLRRANRSLDPAAAERRAEKILDLL